MQKSLLFFTAIFISFFLHAIESISKSGQSNWQFEPFGGSIPWSNVANCNADDGVYSSSSSLIIALGLDTTSLLVINDFDFEIPETAVIHGLEVSVNKRAANSNALFKVSDGHLVLINDSSIISEDKATSGAWPNFEVTQKYGHSSDLWNAGLTPAIVNDSSFGIGLSAAYWSLLGILSISMDAHIDHVAVEVFYSNPLPVTLNFFKAENMDLGVLLQWETSSEVNNDYFTIQFSTDNKYWHSLAQIKGNGNSNHHNSYQFIHQINKKQTTYYRLTQTDFNGSSETFAPIAIQASPKVKNQKIKLYPTYSSHLFTLESPIPLVQVQIHTLSGQLVAHEFVRKHEFTFGNELQPGKYVLTALDENREIHQFKIGKLD